MLSKSQFSGLASRLHAPDGGYTVDVKTGKEPQGGFMVSKAGHDRTFGAKATVRGSDIDQHVSDNAAELSKRARLAGGWHNPETHEKDLDVSRHYRSHDRARSAMWGADQDALYNANEGRSERNFAKLGTAGSSIGHFLHADPDPPAEYDELRRAAKDRHH